MSTRLIFAQEKLLTVPFCAANQRNRPDQFQLARALREKGGRDFILATRDSSLGNRTQQEVDSNSRDRLVWLLTTGRANNAYDVPVV